MTNTWTHLLTTWSPTDDYIKMYYNGTLVDLEQGTTEVTTFQNRGLTIGEVSADMNLALDELLWIERSVSVCSTCSNKHEQAQFTKIVCFEKSTFTVTSWTTQHGYCYRQSLKQNVKNLQMAVFAIFGLWKSCKLDKTIKNHIWMIWGLS